MIAIGLQDANDSDNIKKEIAINIPASLTVSGFLSVINALPLFKISETELPIFKAITTDLEPVTYYVELLNVGKGTYGTGGLQLTAANVRITSSSATSTDIVSLPNTQIIDLGYIGDSVVWGLNIQNPNIIIQEQNEGYVLVKGIFENGEYHEYLWIGTGGAYGQDGGLQATGYDLKEMSSVTAGIAKATSAYSGTVKLDTDSADPTVYIKDTVDNLLGDKANLVGGKVPSEQLPSYVDDVLELANYASLPVIGETGKIYVTTNDNKQYRWTGSIYISFSSGVSTTLKPILSTALATQNVAGFVTYINALNPVLIVGASEIVKYNLTDTGRVFELNLRGRSFGVGQPAIVAADVLEVTDFLNKDIRFSNYPSTRNDGQLPTNKVLAPDANGNVKLYSIAIAPAPFIKELIPDSYYPSTTGNIRILGDFFTPQMCDRVANPTAIIMNGVTTIHYATFINSQEILVNVTTGAVEGSFSVTLNNGLSTTKTNALLLVLGTVYTPEFADWINVVEPIDFDSGSLIVQTIGSMGQAEFSKRLDTTKNFRFYILPTLSPFDAAPLGHSGTPDVFQLYDINNNLLFKCSNYNNQNLALNDENANLLGYFATVGELFVEIRIDYVAGIWYFYRSGNLFKTATTHNNLNVNAKIKLFVARFDLTKIRYVELA